VLCTRGGLFGALVLNSLIACDRIELCGIVRSSRWFHPGLGFLGGAIAYLRRSGLSYSLYLACATTLSDVLCGFGKTQRVPLRSRPGGMPVHTTPDINSPEALEFLGDCRPELLVSAFFDQRLHEPALAVATLACLNIHPSLLPALKGVDPVLQARLKGLGCGVTVHYMTPALDSGPILAQASVASARTRSVFDATAHCFLAGSQLLVEKIDRVAHGYVGAPQDAEGSYQGWPSRADIRALRRRGGTLIRLSDLTGIFSGPERRRTTAETARGAVNPPL
jgi:methionyl-tRNA formyltransferase